MELNEQAQPWIQQLAAAVKPYLEFVDQVAETVSDLGPRVSETSKTIDAQVTKIQNLQTQLTELKNRLQNDEPQTQITVLKTSLMEAKAQAQNSADALTRAEAKIQSLETARASESFAAESSAPVSFESAAKRRDPRAVHPKQPAFPERHVLLIDDAEINRVLMSHYFKGLPVKLEFAVSVMVALEKCKNRRFDLIVVDDELQDLENPILRSSSNQIVGLSNGSSASLTPVQFEHVLNRGQAREAFVEQLKGFLWDAERIA